MFMLRDLQFVRAENVNEFGYGFIPAKLCQPVSLCLYVCVRLSVCVVPIT